MKTNLILIGMPGSGKSTIGVLLAKEAGLSFVDTDLVIQAEEGRCLQTIVDTDGYLALRAIEERVLLSLDLQEYVIATGGSVVYSDVAMQHLKRLGTAIFLQASIETLESRITNYATRGLAKHPDQSFDELFAERSDLYTRYADLTIPCDRLSQESICEKILRQIDIGQPPYTS
ncbi:MAG: shikimate kinase [Planctomycetota bacterium]|jgi:shikimate kinase